MQFWSNTPALEHHVPFYLTPLCRKVWTSRSAVARVCQLIHRPSSPRRLCHYSVVHVKPPGICSPHVSLLLINVGSRFCHVIRPCPDYIRVLGACLYLDNPHASHTPFYTALTLPHAVRRLALDTFINVRRAQSNGAA